MLRTTNATVTRAAIVVLAAGCGGLDNCPGVAVGDQVEFELYEPWVDSPTSLDDVTACAQEWGFAESDTFRGRVTEARGDYDCRAGVLEVAEHDGWTYEPIRLLNFKGLGIVLAGNHAVAKRSVSRANPVEALRRAGVGLRRARG